MSFYVKLQGKELLEKINLVLESAWKGLLSYVIVKFS